MVHYFIQCCALKLESQPHQPKLPNVRAVNKASSCVFPEIMRKKNYDEPRDPDDEET
jgi:hypothetical protein